MRLAIVLIWTTILRHSVVFLAGWAEKGFYRLGWDFSLQMFDLDYVGWIALRAEKRSVGQSQGCLLGKVKKNRIRGVMTAPR